MSRDERQAHLHEIALYALYAGFCALLVPVLFVPDFLLRVSGAEVYKSVIILFGPYTVVMLLAQLDRRFGARD